MAQKEILDKLSIYIPQSKMDQKPVERLINLGKKRDRSVNYLVVEAILDYLKREEKQGEVAILVRVSSGEIAETGLMALDAGGDGSSLNRKLVPSLRLQPEATGQKSAHATRTREPQLLLSCWLEGTAALG